jgi:hypothetical protein
VGKRVGGPPGVELLEAAVVSFDAREVDAAEMPQRLARLRGEIRVIRGATRVVELHASRFASHVDQAREQVRAANGDSPAREVARDRGQLVLLAHPLLVARETERSETAGDNEEYSNDPHRQRIGTGPNGLEKVG